MEEPINQRFAKILYTLGITETELAKRLGIKPQSVNAWKGSKTNPSLHNMINLLRVFPELSARYVLFGSGPVLEKGLTLEANREPVAYPVPTLMDELKRQLTVKDDQIAFLQRLVDKISEPKT